MSDPRSISIDFDKTLTQPTSDEWGPAFTRQPNEEMIERVQEAYFNGNRIVVWTARQWNEASQIAGWLTAHDVPFHGLMCGKGSADEYVDDKATTPDKFINDSTN